MFLGRSLYYSDHDRESLANNFGEIFIHYNSVSEKVFDMPDIMSEAYRSSRGLSDIVLYISDIGNIWCSFYMITVGQYVRRFAPKRRTLVLKRRTCPDVRRFFKNTAIKFILKSKYC